MCRRHPIVRVNIAVLAAIAAFSILLVREVQAQEPNALGLPCNTTSDAIAPDRKVAIPIDAALLTGRIPCAEAVNPAGPLGDDQLRNLQRGFDFYSWLTFIALNAPASGTGIANSQPGTKAKWEDTQNFIQLLEVMRRDRKEPEWNREDRTALIPQACRSDYTKGMMVVEMIEESYNQPFRTGPLIDQRGRFAIFDILMNKEMFDYIMKHGLHRQSTQKKFADRVDFPAGNSNTLGSFMLKVSWKVMDAEDDPRKFHTTDAIVILPRREDEAGEPACMKATLGLIGFHAVHKTIGRLQWIWTSFEHVDNVPEQIEVDAGPARLKKSYNFFDPSCDRRKCPVNETPPRPWAPNNSLRHHPLRSRARSRASFRSRRTRRTSTPSSRLCSATRCGKITCSSAHNGRAISGAPGAALTRTLPRRSQEHHQERISRRSRT